VQTTDRQAGRVRRANVVGEQVRAEVFRERHVDGISEGDVRSQTPGVGEKLV
jgi:hypothetical protein